MQGSITQNKNWPTDSDYSLQNRILKVCIDALLAVIPETLTCCSSCGFVWSTGRGTSTYIGGNGSVMIVQITCWREGRLVILVTASFSCPWQGSGLQYFVFLSTLIAKNLKNCTEPKEFVDWMNGCHALSSFIYLKSSNALYLCSRFLSEWLN